jgi:5-methylcytosine-specific restriction endonuclease McrA
MRARPSPAQLARPSVRTPDHVICAVATPRDPSSRGVVVSTMWPMSQHTEDGARFRRARRAFLAANRTCWICGHVGADTIDHVVPRSVRRTSLDYANWRPAHGVRGCDHCVPHADGRPRRCNQERGIKPNINITNVYVPKIHW